MSLEGPGCLKTPLMWLQIKLLFPPIKHLSESREKKERSVRTWEVVFSLLWGLRKENVVAKATSEKGTNESKNICTCPLLSTTPTAWCCSRAKHRVLEGKGWCLVERSSCSLHVSDNNTWRFCCYFVLVAIKPNRDKKSVCIFLTRFSF